jgi:hypothetical protein
VTTVDRSEGPRRARSSASRLQTGAGFRNVHPILPGLRSRYIPAPTPREFLFERGRCTPGSPLPPADPRDRWSTDSTTYLRATWLGQSTVLIEIDGARMPAPID